MRIAKPLLMVTTPLGVGWGIYEAFRLTGGLALVMVALVLIMSVAATTVVVTIRREKRQDEARREAQARQDTIAQAKDGSGVGN